MCRAWRAWSHSNPVRKGTYGHIYISLSSEESAYALLLNFALGLKPLERMMNGFDCNPRGAVVQVVAQAVPPLPAFPLREDKPKA